MDIVKEDVILISISLMENVIVYAHQIYHTELMLHVCYHVHSDSYLMVKYVNLIHNHVHQDNFIIHKMDFAQLVHQDAQNVYIHQDIVLVVHQVLFYRIINVLIQIFVGQGDIDNLMANVLVVLSNVDNVYQLINV
jgi:hypothetical protein